MIRNTFMNIGEATTGQQCSEIIVILQMSKLAMACNSWVCISIFPLQFKCSYFAERLYAAFTLIYTLIVSIFPVKTKVIRNGLIYIIKANLANIR